eukprot:6458025-Amphidinium_carterae.2
MRWQLFSPGDPKRVTFSHLACAGWNDAWGTIEDYSRGGMSAFETVHGLGVCWSFSSLAWRAAAELCVDEVQSLSELLRSVLGVQAGGADSCLRLVVNAVVERIAKI